MAGFSWGTAPGTAHAREQKPESAEMIDEFPECHMAQPCHGRQKKAVFDNPVLYGNTVSKECFNPLMVISGQARCLLSDFTYHSHALMGTKLKIFGILHIASKVVYTFFEVIPRKWED